MATENLIRILEDTDKWTSRAQSSNYGSASSTKLAIEDFSLFLKSQKFQCLGKDSIPGRSESAPPSMEGSIAAIDNIISLRKSSLNPANGSDVNLDIISNKPFNSWENARPYHHSGSTGSDWKMMPRVDSTDDSVGVHRKILPSHEEESEDDRSSEHSASVDKATLLDYQCVPLDSTLGDSHHAPSPSVAQYINKSVEEPVSDADSLMLQNLSICGSLDAADSPGLGNLKQVSQLDSTGLSGSHDDGRDTVGSPPAHVRKNFNSFKGDIVHELPASGVEDVGIFRIDVRNSANGSSAINPEQKFKIDKEQQVFQNYSLQQQADNSSRVQGSYSQTMYPEMSHTYGGLQQFHYGPSAVSMAETQPILQTSGFTPPFYTQPASFMTPQTPCYPNMHPAGFFTPQYSMGGYTYNSVFPPYLAGYPHQSVFPLVFDGFPFAASGVSDRGSAHANDIQNPHKFYGQGVSMQSSSTDPYNIQYFQPPVRNSYVSNRQLEHHSVIEDASMNQANARDVKKGQDFIAFSNDKKPQYAASVGYNSVAIGRGTSSNPYSFGGPTNVGSLMQFQSPSPFNPVVPAKPGGGINFSGGRNNTTHSQSFYNNTGKTYGQKIQNWNDNNSNSFLEELKSGRGQRFELSDVVGHIGEFSIDQHGSRFIQQKLEHCSAEEKSAVFKEVIPHASKLMTDVFGNYVIQKLFEYGSEEQKRDLANQLEGQILPLSLQMYGCRVIQKAFEVIDLEQKVRLARELEGHVMRCVRDQNGNHVIQKCIESIPVDSIHFIISSFHGQVATLSMHPYGCRVIQRVLEHCNDDLQTEFIINEILDSVCSLAQDQYGNYVTQHVMERGITRERSEIIEKLSGSIVQLSQHKFASNVIEKCLEYSDSVARDLLIKEIIGHGDKDDSVLMMMKDQYGNYVIQKILQICSSDQREMLLGVMRNHLTVLKKYTYGKHIVARLEQLYGEEIQPSGSA